jgi:lactate dehydrogenase-like 2-hydroxyacid dehydrogenase
MKILITRKLAPNVIEKLSNENDLDIWDFDEPIPREELLKRITDVDGLLCLLTDKIDKEILDSAKNLKVISTMSVGYDHIDVEECKNRGIKLGFTADVLTDSVADLAMGLMLNSGRRVKEASNAAINGQWTYWKPYWMTGYDLTGATVGIIGFGRIGKAVASRLKGFKCNIIYFDIRRDEQAEQELGVEYKSLDEVLQASDFITLHVAPTKETSNMINSETLSKMKPNAVLVNTSRGSLVNTDDLVEALKNKVIFAAGIDTVNPEPLPMDHPLFKLENCIVLPHIASATNETRNKMGLLAADNLISGLADKPMPKEILV